MKSKLSMIIIILLFLLGVGIISYPFVSNWVNQRRQADLVETYDEIVESLSNEEIAAELARVAEYNKSLYNNAILTDPFDESLLAETTEEYMSLLDVHQDGILGYLEIPLISVKLPIYHGTSSEVLEKGVGHLQGSSLPIGGTGTHSILSAHTGLPSAKMFDDLVNLKEGDEFYLTVLGETMAYAVDSIKVVLPDNVSDLGIDYDEDYVTLVTCTPYGVNTHRLLVRGTRVPYHPETAKAQAAPDNNMWLILLIIVVLVIAAAWIIIRRRKKKKAFKELAKQSSDSLTGR